MRRPGGGSVSVTVTPYWTTLLVVVEVWSIPVTLPVARAPCIASKVTEASWPFLTFATSVSVNSPLICSFPVSAMVMKPLPVELELELLPDEEPPVPPLDPLLPELPVLPEEELELLDPEEEPPTVPLTATIVPLNGALS